MARMLVCYYTRTHHTQHMAGAIADGARQVAGVSVDLLAVADVKVPDLSSYDAIIMGSPTYYGSMAAEVKKLLDESVSLHGKLGGRIGGAFASSANVGGGNETTVLDILHGLMIHGMIVQGVHWGDHYGPVAIGDMDDRAKENCTRYGKTIAELTVKLRG